MSGVWGEQSSGAGEFAVLWSAFCGCSCGVLCVVEWETGVWGRVTRSAVGASDTGRWALCKCKGENLCGGLVYK